MKIKNCSLRELLNLKYGLQLLRNTVSLNCETVMYELKFRNDTFLLKYYCNSLKSIQKQERIINKLIYEKEKKIK